MKRIVRFLLPVLILSLSACREPIRTPVPEPTVQTLPLETEAHCATAPDIFPTEAAQTLPPTEPSETLPPTEPPLPSQPEPRDSDFVRVQDYIPDMFVELPYATENNFTGKKIYDFDTVWLRYGTVKKLVSVLEELRQRGLSLKIWDGFRPPSAQFKLWEVCPDPAYVSDPNNGFSSHSSGNTVDITLVYADGAELVMPTGFDDFSELADRDYSDCSKEAADNALMLEKIMTEYGFKPYSGEWWHYTDTQTYPVEQSFEPIEISWYYADCSEFISLRTAPDTLADIITRIPANEEFQILARHGDFWLVNYQGLFGYVLQSYTYPTA